MTTSARMGKGATEAVATMACSRPAAADRVSRSISAQPAMASVRATCSGAVLCTTEHRRQGPGARPGQHRADGPTGERADHDDGARHAGQAAEQPIPVHSVSKLMPTR